MEGIGNQGRRTFTFLLLMLMSSGVLTIEMQCEPWFYENDGICCNKCHPGFKLVEKCTANKMSNCTRCGEDEFSDQINYSPTCRRCKRCKDSKNEYEVSPCERHSNTKCQCKKGYYKHNIDSETYDCVKCKKCGANEVEIQPCTPESDTVCDCKENFFREKGKCELCTRCTLNCAQHCTTPVVTKGPAHHHPQFVNLIIGFAAVVVLLVLGILITFIVTKRSFHKKMLSLSSKSCVPQTEQSKDFLVTITEPSVETSLKDAVETSFGEQELSKLPDCVPMIPDFIYSVLDLVPLQQMKQLVRSLGVTDTEIEQAEMDNRYCREAHYQMLRVWVQRAPRTVKEGKGETIHRQVLEELLSKLRQLHLGQAAEELETKYAIQ
ncbi:tumor necrosis factor receptor superfamily member 1A [Poeciliopsis prolifica]|uniref:tumor necrosis factor receptor superfamily member 1A n=1 Tax=Poeciliopsis prolifica TaxID=188132 RepID=UPI0024134251|nr:tumor necrosis factor receptor superfamily member 1A [Poeciliopsis prolifica]